MRVRRHARWVMISVLSLISACSAGDPAADGPGVATVNVLETLGQEPASSSTETSATTGRDSECTPPVIALDPGHNGTITEEFDPETGALMRDYPNGAEDQDVMDVALRVQEELERAGYRVVLLKTSVDEDVTYRERVDRAEQAGADVGVSIHTYTADRRIFVQRVGSFRRGTGSDGQPLTVAFENSQVAEASQKLGEAFAAGRTEAEGHTVTVGDISFDGRPPLWAGNIPIIALISDEVPWVYNEFGTAAGGGANPIGDEGIERYAQGLVQGVKKALPNTCR